MQFFIETKNTPLEEIAKHFDGENAIVGGAAATDKGLQLAREAGLDDTVRSASIARGDTEMNSYAGNGNEKSGTVHVMDA